MARRVSYGVLGHTSARWLATLWYRLRPTNGHVLFPTVFRHECKGSFRLATAHYARLYESYRATRGDRVHALLDVLSYPPNWQQASLPKALSPAEVERLVDSLVGRGHRRAGTLTLRRTKSRREDRLPLLEATGRRKLPV